MFNSVELLSRVRLFATLWTAARHTSLSITNSQSLLRLMSIESVRPSNHLILCRPLLLPPSILPSIRVFSNESALCIRWPEYWSFTFSIESFQGTLRTDLLQDGLAGSPCRPRHSRVFPSTTTGKPSNLHPRFHSKYSSPVNVTTSSEAQPPSEYHTIKR